MVAKYPLEAESGTVACETGEAVAAASKRLRSAPEDESNDRRSILERVVDDPCDDLRSRYLGAILWEMAPGEEERGLRLPGKDPRLLPGDLCPLEDDLGSRSKGRLPLSEDRWFLSEAACLWGDGLLLSVPDRRRLCADLSFL
jgi:hypothetical protein